MQQNPQETKDKNASSTDRIRKHVVLRASRARVWRALTQAEEFGKWFGANLTGQFLPGSTVRGPITHPGFEKFTMEIVIDRVEPQHLISFRWHPYAVEPGVDYSSEPTTLVTFELAETPEGISLTVTESGFDDIPAGRRALAFRMNEGGWEIQMQNISRHLAEIKEQ